MSRTREPGMAHGPAELLILGTFHMANPGRDVVNLDVDDVLAPHRQAELEDLAHRIAQFRPTKVCVEAVNQDRIDAKFSSYLNGTAEPSRNEIDQLAFRVARLCGLSRVWAIDAEYPMVWEGLNRYLEAHPEEAKVYEDMIAGLRREREQDSERLRKTTIREFLLEMNTEETLREDHGWYIELLRFGGVGEYGSADLLASWYQRNIRIFSNLASLAEPGDRIFVLIGGGHVPILRQLAAASPRYKLVEVRNVLQ